MSSDLAAAVAGIGAGIITRYYLLRVDYRNYPSFPHGYVTHIALGVVASFLGGVAIPALVAREYTAVTFLALAAQQFREVRDLVRKSLQSVESMELVKRGPDYIEGIARVFEARNYMVMLVAVSASGGMMAGGVLVSVVLALAAFAVAVLTMRGQTVGDIVDVIPSEFHFDGPSLYVDNVFIMNVGLPEQRRDLAKWGKGVLLIPSSARSRDAIASAGQRQSMLHDATAAVGIRKDIAAPEFTPLARRDHDDGRIGLFITPMEGDTELLIEAIKRTPVLEAALGTGSKGGRSGH